MKEVRADCCDWGRHFVHWSGEGWWWNIIGHGSWPAKACICGTKLEPPKPPRKIVLDEEARAVIESAADEIEKLHDKCPPGGCLRAGSLRALLDAATGGE